ncbi:MAG: hypothetical protein J6U06_03490 [Spirochaetaceae bacterium]|nr:hypothetical protein [Spirochaetaceae bacterium]
MSPERIAELQNRPIDLSDIPEITADQAKEFYPRSFKKSFQVIYNLFDKENLIWLEQNGLTNRVAINRVLEKLRNGTLNLA